MIEYISTPHIVHPHCEHHHDDEHISSAVYYTSLLGQFNKHKNNWDIHVSNEDRYKWDNKADKSALEELELLLARVGGKEIPTAVSQLTNDVPYISRAELDTILFAKDAEYESKYGKNGDNSYITRDELTTRLNGYLLTQNFLGYAKINGFITRQDLDTLLSDYLLKSNLLSEGRNAGFLTKNDIGDFIKGTDVLFYYNNNPIYKGGHVIGSGDNIINPGTIDQTTFNMMLSNASSTFNSMLKNALSVTPVITSGIQIAKISIAGDVSTIYGDGRGEGSIIPDTAYEYVRDVNFYNVYDNTNDPNAFKIATIKVKDLDGLEDTTELWIPGGGGGSYTAGEGLYLSGNTFNLKVANPSGIGGVKTNYIENTGSNRYKLQVDNYGNGFVHVPPMGANGDTIASYLYFMNVLPGTVVTKPAANMASIEYAGWTTENTTEEGKETWMIVIYKNGDNITQINGPYKISNVNGTNGEDGVDIEFIYRSSNHKLTTQELDIWMNALRNAGSNNGKSFADDDYIPADWNDNPQGLEDFPYEYMSMRVSTNDETTHTKVWDPTKSMWAYPVLWSAYGERGIDGDGVEYIFYASSALTWNDVIGGDLSSTLDPRNWLISQTNEYIENNAWKDNPISLSEGQRQWVSIRKKQEGVWGAYSEPAIWGYYARDGVVQGYTVDLTNENLVVCLDNNGDIDHFEGSSKLLVFSNLTEFWDNTISVSFGTVTRSDGNSITYTTTSGGSEEVYVHQHQSNSPIIDVELNNVSNLDGVTIFIPIIVTIGSSDAKQVNLCLTGVQVGAAGAPGSSIDLYTSASVIKSNFYKTEATPDSISVGVKIVTGNGSGATVSTYSAGSTAADDLGFEFRYRYEHSDGSTSLSWTTLNESSITNLDQIGDYDQLKVELLFNNSRIDFETIPVVYDGEPGSRGEQGPVGPRGEDGEVPIIYRIDVIGSTLHTDYEKTNFEGTLKFKVFRVSDEIEEITNPVAGTETIGVIFPTGPHYTTKPSNLFTAGSLQYNAQDGCWKILKSLSEVRNDMPYAQIVVRTQDPTSLPNTFTIQLASVVVPFAVTGADGVSRVQGLSGVVMRMFDYSKLTSELKNNQIFYCGENASEDGVTYLDVVKQDGLYYYPKYDGIIGETYQSQVEFGQAYQGDVSLGNLVSFNGVSVYVLGLPKVGVQTGKWILFETMSDAAFHNLLVTNASYIENLTSKNVVIVDNNNNLEAGITSGDGQAFIDKGINGVVTTQNSESVRIWAGDPKIGNSVNLFNCPFYVTEDGRMKSENAEVTGTINAELLRVKDLVVDNANSELQINDGPVRIWSEHTQNGGHGAIEVNSTGASVGTNPIDMLLDNNDGFSITSGAGGDAEGSLFVGIKNNAFKITTSWKYQSGTGFTGTINGAKFINGICVGTA